MRATCRTSAEPNVPRTRAISRGLRIGSRAMTSNRDRFCPYKFCFELRFTVFPQHRDHFSQIAAQFFQSGALRMSTGKSGHITNKQFCLWIALDNRSECSHDQIVTTAAISCNSSLVTGHSSSPQRTRRPRRKTNQELRNRGKGFPRYKVKLRR